MGIRCVHGQLQASPALPAEGNPVIHCTEWRVTSKASFIHNGGEEHQRPSEKRKL